MKGASGTTNIWKLRLQLMKPVTWIPLIWGVVCGAAASGNYEWRVDHVLAAFACMLMSGPLLAGFTQTINDYYDREIDGAEILHRTVGVLLQKVNHGLGNAITHAGHANLGADRDGVSLGHGLRGLESGATLTVAFAPNRWLLCV